MVKSQGGARARGRNSKLVAAGRRPEWTGDPRLGGGIVNPPLWRASTILYDNVADLDARGKDTHDKLYYGRRGTPTVWALADALTGMEDGAAGTLLFPSGVAAISAALLALLSPGDHLLMVDSAYEPTRSFCDNFLLRMDIETSYYDPMIGAKIATLIQPNTKVIFTEAPGSLTFEVQDIPAIVAVAKAHDIVTILDNSWASPLLFPALAKGIDISMMSLSKYIGGHSDAMMGSLTINAALWPRLRQNTYLLGQTVSADDAALMLRGLRTLDVRLERQGRSALAIAKWLAVRDDVAMVRHPGLADCPGYDYFLRDFAGASGLFAFALKNADKAKRARFIDALTLFGIGFSWGGFESLAVPADPPRSAMPWTGGDALIRLSIGLEDVEDLIADLSAAFATMEG